MLLELGGARVLTDPNFDRRLAGVLRRVSAPGIALDQIPHLDAVLISHGHADHLSVASLAVLASRQTPLLAPPAVAARLRRRGFTSAQAIAPGEWTTIGGLTITADRAAHRVRGRANMYLLDDGTASAFFAGDTGLRAGTHRLVESIGGRRLDVALLPIGHAPWWRPGFRRGHLSSEDALALFERLGARYLIPYHWGTFQHLTSGPYDAKRRLDGLLAAHPRSGDVIALAPGASHAV